MSPCVQEGCLRLQGQTPCQTGIPQWRTRVAYVHQSRVNYKGTPFDLFDCARQFCAQRKRPHGDLGALVEELGMPASVCSQPWSELSVGALTHGSWGPTGHCWWVLCGECFLLRLGRLSMRSQQQHARGERVLL
jgi:hypothetical protein